MSSTDETVIGIEGGGTKTIAIAAQADATQTRIELGPGNVRLLTDKDLHKLFGEIAAMCPTPTAVGVGMAGMREEADERRIRSVVEAVWGRVRVAITHDLAIALAAAKTDSKTNVLVLSGTGSCCFGQSGDRQAKVGGWGHLLGDRGSGYEIAHSALRELVREFDRKGKWGPLGEQVLRALMLNEPNDVIGWIQSAPKSEIAALAATVFATAQDPISRKVIAAAAKALASDGVICASRLASKREAVTFVFAGSVILKQAAFGKKIASLIRKEFARAVVMPLEREAAWGAIEIARSRGSEETPGSKQRRETRDKAQSYYVPDFQPAASPTEQRNPKSARFHELSTKRMVELMLETETETVPALRKEQKAILRAVELAVETLKRDGRIFYVGAGTSGRLGILDASECPPTFRASPEMIQGIIAGGQRAIWQAVEGAEDDADAGARAVESRAVKAKDLVVGIAASGRTPFVWGALGKARTIGAKTVLLCFNPSLEIQKEHRPDVVIAPDLGPEILTGSTRLKSGTATKIVLNMISTIAMVHIGKVIGNLMVDLNPSNVKLRDRAVRIVQELTGRSAEESKAALEKKGWVVKEAWASLKRGKG